MTILYYTSFENRMSDDLFAEKLNLLSSGFRQRTLNYRRWQDAHASLFGKLLLLEGFKNFGISARLSDLNFTNYGKPYLPDSSICFNISHSGFYVVCAVSDEVETLGVDIELIRPIDIANFQNFWVGSEWIEILSDHPRIFYKYWTRKEAVVKADGRGLRIPFKEIDARCGKINFNDRTYFVRTMDLDVNYVLHLAALKDFAKVDQIGIPLTAL